MIRRCDQSDEATIYHVINESAKAYKGIIAEDCYHEPYILLEELRSEMNKMMFFGYEEHGEILAVAGYQLVNDVTLVRHTYVLPEHQRKSVGGKLLDHIKHITTTRRLLVGTWKVGSWAISFYQRYGFTLLANKDELLRRYWKISERQIELSVVLGITLPSKNLVKKEEATKTRRKLMDAEPVIL